MRGHHQTVNLKRCGETARTQPMLTPDGPSGATYRWLGWWWRLGGLHRKRSSKHHKTFFREIQHEEVPFRSHTNECRHVLAVIGKRPFDVCIRTTYLRRAWACKELSSFLLRRDRPWEFSSLSSRTAQQSSCLEHRIGRGVSIWIQRKWQKRSAGDFPSFVGHQNK